MEYCPTRTTPWTYPLEETTRSIGVDFHFRMEHPVGKIHFHREIGIDPYVKSETILRESHFAVACKVIFLKPFHCFVAGSKPIDIFFQFGETFFELIPKLKIKSFDNMGFSKEQYTVEATMTIKGHFKAHFSVKGFFLLQCKTYQCPKAQSCVPIRRIIQSRRGGRGKYHSIPVIDFHFCRGPAVHAIIGTPAKTINDGRTYIYLGRRF